MYNYCMYFTAADYGSVLPNLGVPWLLSLIGSWICYPSWCAHRDVMTINSYLLAGKFPFNHASLFTLNQHSRRFIHD